MLRNLKHDSKLLEGSLVFLNRASHLLDCWIDCRILRKNKHFWTRLLVFFLKSKEPRNQSELLCPCTESKDSSGQEHYTHMVPWRAPTLSKTVKKANVICASLYTSPWAPPCPYPLMQQDIFIEHLLYSRHSSGCLVYISLKTNKQTDVLPLLSTQGLFHEYPPCAWNCAQHLGQWLRNLAWHLSNSEALCKYGKIRKGKWCGYHLSYLVKNWRWRKGTWKGHSKVPRQRKQTPMSCPVETSGWPHCAGSLELLRVASGCSSCHSSRRSAPSPQWTWRHSGKTWVQNTRHRSHKIRQDL